MSFAHMEFEKINIPENYKELILGKQPFTDALKKKGFSAGFWHWPTKSDVALTINEDNGTWWYKIDIYTSGDDFDAFEEYSKEWAAEKNISGEKTKLWAAWIKEKIETTDNNLTDDMKFTINEAFGNKDLYILTNELPTFQALINVIFSSLSSLAEQKFAQLDNALQAAAEDAGKIEGCADIICENLAGMVEYKDLWNRTNAIFAAHGVTKETLKLLSVVSVVPSRTLKKELETLCKAFPIEDTLKNDAPLAEDLFFNLQASYQEYYLLQKDSGYATKGLIKKVAKLIVISLEVFGFSIHLGGLKTMIRTFENDSVEGIGLDMYQGDVAYDSNDFGYYDSMENEGYYDQLWAGIDMAALIK